MISYVGWDDVVSLPLRVSVINLQRVSFSSKHANRNRCSLFGLMHACFSTSKNGNQRERQTPTTIT
jgi:hypothetical protein